MATPEAKAKAKIKKILAKYRVWNFVPVSKGMGQHGIPDFVGCIPCTITLDMVGRKVGLFVGIEAKAEGKFATAHQIFIMKMIKRAWGLAFDLRPSEFSQLEELLKRIQKGNDEI